MFKHILVATDGSPLASKALSAAVSLAKSCGATVTALLVVPDYTAHEYAEVVIGDAERLKSLRPSLIEAGDRRLAKALAEIGSDGVAVTPQVVVSDEPHQEIVTQAERGQCDLVVMASRGRGPLKSAFLGSQTVKVIAASKVPVLVVK